LSLGFCRSFFIAASAPARRSPLLRSPKAASRRCPLHRNVGTTQLRNGCGESALERVAPAGPFIFGSGALGKMPTNGRQHGRWPRPGVPCREGDQEGTV
jgi:hypothetical protein